MKEISELNLPDDRKYTRDHEWAKVDGDVVTIGINDYAQDQLGEIVFVEMPQPGDTFAREDEFGTMESVKAVSELYCPVSGEVTEVNGDLESAPEQVNQDCYGRGWIIRIKPENPGELDELMDKAAYLAMLKG